MAEKKKTAWKPNPGPLRVLPPEQTAGWGWCVADAHAILLSLRGSKVPAAQKKADATMFASAPDLLEALQSLLDHVQIDLKVPDSEITVCKAKAAIRKATGGTWP